MRSNFEKFKQKALSNIEVRKEYDELKPIFAIKKELIKARLERGFTQEEIAKKMGTTKSNISRLESLNNSYIPNLRTLINYARTLGTELKISL